MTKEKMIEVCGRYAYRLMELEYELKGGFLSDKVHHCRWMVSRIPGLLEEGRIDKANRWLGFVQGYLWTTGVYSIEEMREHNKPDEGV